MADRSSRLHRMKLPAAAANQPFSSHATAAVTGAHIRLRGPVGVHGWLMFASSGVGRLPAILAGPKAVVE